MRGGTMWVPIPTWPRGNMAASSLASGGLLLHNATRGRAETRPRAGAADLRPDSSSDARGAPARRAGLLPTPGARYRPRAVAPAAPAGHPRRRGGRAADHPARERVPAALAAAVAGPVPLPPAPIRAPRRLPGVRGAGVDLRVRRDGVVAR